MMRNSQLHPDKFAQRVKDEGMIKDATKRFAAFTMAKDALHEWNEVALDKKKQRQVQEGELELEHLRTWENEIRIQGKGCYMDYDDFPQPK